MQLISNKARMAALLGQGFLTLSFPTLGTQKPPNTYSSSKCLIPVLYPLSYSTLPLKNSHDGKIQFWVNIENFSQEWIHEVLFYGYFLYSPKYDNKLPWRECQLHCARFYNSNEDCCGISPWAGSMRCLWVHFACLLSCRQRAYPQVFVFALSKSSKPFWFYNSESLSHFPQTMSFWLYIQSRLWWYRKSNLCVQETYGKISLQYSSLCCPAWFKFIDGSVYWIILIHSHSWTHFQQLEFYKL